MKSIFILCLSSRAMYWHSRRKSSFMDTGINEGDETEENATSSPPDKI